MRRLKRTLSSWQKALVSEDDKTHDNKHDKKAAGRKAWEAPPSCARQRRRCRRRSQAARRTMHQTAYHYKVDGRRQHKGQDQAGKRHGRGRTQDSKSTPASAPMQGPMQETTDRAAAKTPGGQYHLSLSLCTPSKALCRACRAAPCALTKPPIITTSFFDFPPF